MNTIHHYISAKQEQLKNALENLLPKEEGNTLFEAMRYVLFAGGKRFRPLLVYTTAESLSPTVDQRMLDVSAAAAELIHNYSLIHDDLPCMDDDDIRHGKPSCHKIYGEAIAILTGDALISLAFEILSSPTIPLDRTSQLLLIQQLATASGAKGMILGQVLDIIPEESASIESIKTIHAHKTGALIEASVLMGAYTAGCLDTHIITQLKEFSRTLGLAYQIQDDILDLESSSEHLGKPAQSDLKNDKQTYPILAGINDAKKEVGELFDAATHILNEINLGKSRLAELVAYFKGRSK